MILVPIERDFLLVGHCDWSYLASFLRFGDLLAKNFSIFPLHPPHSHSAPPLAIFPLEFRAEVNHPRGKRVMGLFYMEDRMIVA